MTETPKNADTGHLDLGTLGEPYRATVVHLPHLEATSLHAWLRARRQTWMDEGKPLRIAVLADTHLGAEPRTLSILRKAVSMTGFELVAILGEQSSAWSAAMGVPAMEGKPKFSLNSDAVSARTAQLSKIKGETSTTKALADSRFQADIPKTPETAAAMAVIESCAAGDTLLREVDITNGDANSSEVEETILADLEATRQAAEDEEFARAEEALALMRAEAEAMAAHMAEEARIAEELRAAAEAARITAVRAEEARLAAEAEAARLAEEEAEEARIAAETEAARLAEEERIAEEARIAAEAEAARLAEEERVAEEARIAAEAEAARLAEEERIAEDARIAAEVEAARLAEEERIAEDARIAAEVEAARLAEEERIAEEARLAAEAEAYRLAEEVRIAEEERIAEETRLADEARIMEELEAALRAEEEREAARLAEEARVAAEAEAARLAEEARIAESARIAEEAEAARLAEEALAAANATAQAENFDGQQAQTVIQSLVDRGSESADVPSWVRQAGGTANMAATLEAMGRKTAEPGIAKPRKEAPHRVMGIVRTGTVIEHDGDVIIEGSVHSGAEIKASGDIHVYGIAGGRLFAGAKGDRGACLYLHRFDAELISIAGRGRLFEEVPERWKHMPTKIHFDPSNGILRFETLTLEVSNLKRPKPIPA